MKNLNKCLASNDVLTDEEKRTFRIEALRHRKGDNNLNQTQASIAIATKYINEFEEEIGVIDKLLVEYDKKALKAIRKPEKPDVKESVTTETEKDSIDTSPHAKLSDWVASRLEKKAPIKSQELFRQADINYNGTQGDRAYSVKDAYDAMELGVNKFIESKGYSPDVSAEKAQTIVNSLSSYTKLLATQTKRTKEQNEFQQFSTPPAFAFIANWVGGVNKKDVMLEPSAGIGGIAVFAKNAGAKVFVNEFSERRVGFLKELGFDKIFTEDAAQLDNVLPEEIKPTVIIMNPPFSATAGRTSRNATMNGAKHIEQALERLEPEGRLVAIVGQGMALNKIHFKEWWDKIKKEYNVRANIGVSGKEYTKYGTSFDNQIIVIDKSGETDIIIDGKVDSFSELIPVLKDLHKEGRYELTKNKKQQSIASESGSESGVDKTERTDRDRSASLPTVDGLVGGESISVQDGNAGASALPTTRDKPAQIDKSDGLPEKGESATGPEGISTDLDTKPTRMDSRRDSRVSDGSKSEIERTNARTGKGKKEISSAVYDKYIPSVTVKGSKTHITPLVESAAMADSQAPESTYTPNLPKTPIKKGFITDAQLEAIIYAGEAHQQFLKSGERKGFFIGDGTGVGKGREISGIIWDNFRRGDKKAIWLSEKASLLNDAKRDLKGVGWSKGADKVFGLTKTKLGEKIKQKDGILFTQYATLRGKFKDIREDQEETLKDLAIRLNQITKWAGKDFDGVIAFDESHNMGNNIPTRGKRGTTKPAAQALAGVMLQKLLPKAKVVYVSATGATEVSNLAYATRLGLWGGGTPFKNVLDFVEQISGEGISAMELVARDMKSLGMYLARSLSYADVKYERLEHELSPPQTKIYDTLAEGWQLVLGNINEAVEETDGGTTARSAALSQFWGAHQRFFNQIVTAMQMPTVLKKMRKDINDGKAIVVQLINTHATQLENSIALLEDGQGVEDIDMTPRATLMNFIDRSFPTKQYEEFEDENGDVRTRIVYDSKGKAVHNKKALGMKKQLLQDMGGISVPNTALDMIVQEFGADAVAEVTGRKRRIVFDKDGNKIIQKWSDAKAQKDIRDYMDDKKQILIFSKKGGTGSSYHAAMDAKNQRLRRHYLIQPGWVASEAVQGLGRSHRSFQKQPPEFILATTNLPGQKRFLSSIARRLDQLGALTKGQRQTGSQGIFAAKDNLESTHAKDGLRNFFDKLLSGQYKDLTAEEYERQTGISFYDSEGNLKRDLPEMTTFLNRMLSMTQDTQNKVFDYFSNEMDAVIQRHSDLGTLDVGLETITGDSIKVVREDTAFEDKEKNIEAKYVQFELKHPNRSRVKFSRTLHIADKPKYFINKTSKKIRLRDMGSESERTDTKTGEIKKYYKLTNPKGNSVMAEADTFNKKWEEVSKSKAKPIWDTEYKEAPKQITENLHLLTGTLLPLWDRLKGRMAVARLQTDDGKRYLGRKIDSEAINSVLDNLGMDKEKIEMTGEQVADNVLAGGTVQFHNETKLKRSRVAGENRIEYVSIEPYYNFDSRELEGYGLFSEQINWKTRWFVPSGDKAPDVINKIADGKDIVSVKTASRKTNVGDVKLTTTDDNLPGQGLTFSDIQKKFPNQTVTIGKDNIINIRFKNGLGLQITQINHGKGKEYTYAVKSGRMSENGSILGTYFENKVTLNKLLADVFTLSHETFHFLVDNKVITPADRLLLKSKFNTYKKQNKLKANESTFNDKDKSNKENADIRQEENEANIFAQLLEEREKHRNTPLGKLIQKVKDFIDGLLYIGRMSERKLAREVESGKIYSRKPGGKFTGQAKYEQAAEPWYSQLTKSVEGLTQKVMPAQQWKAVLKSSNLKQQGVKEEEIEWSGINDWLDSKKGKVTRQEVVEYLKSNEVVIEEVVKEDTVEGAEKEAYENFSREFDEMTASEYSWLDDIRQEEIENAWEDEEHIIWWALSKTKKDYLKNVANEDAVEDFEEDVKDSLALYEYLPEDRYENIKADHWGEDMESYIDGVTESLISPTKFSQYQLPGGKNYKEVLLRMPAIKSIKFPTYDEWVGNKKKSKQEHDAFWAETAFPEKSLPEDTSREEYKRVKKAAQEQEPSYKSSHYDEPNILVHMRMSEREVDGKRVLHVEEVQSDWMQEGRKKGFVERYKADDVVPITEKDNAAASQPELFWYFEVPGNILQIPKSKYTTEKEAKEYVLSEKLKKEGVPQAPFKTKWSLLAIKHLIRYAAENNFDTLAWTQGQEQADRYDLSKQISKVTYTKNKTLRAYDHSGKQVMSKVLENDNQIEDHIGKEATNRLLNSPVDEIQDTGMAGKPPKGFSIEGEDLKVGGEGMKAFYDKMLPSTVNKFFNKKAWGKAKVGEIEIEADGTKKLWSIPITPEIKSKSLREGMPLFRVEDKTSKQRLEQRLVHLQELYNKKENKDDTTFPTYNNIKALKHAIEAADDIKFQIAPDKKTPEFREWFGDSKVTDEKGEPLVVYHGTDVDFTVFDIDRGELGAHFGTKEIAVDRIELSEDPAFTKGDQVKPVYLSLQNPYDMVSDLGDWNDMGMLEEHLAEANEGPFTNEEFSKFKTSRDVREGLIKKGYDGIKYINTFEYAPEGEAGSYIAFSPNQVKSVFNLKPTKASQDIRYQTSEDRASTTSQTAERIYTPDQQAYKQAGGFGQKKTETFREKFDKIKILAGDKLRQGTVDQFHSLNKVLKDKQAWMMAHLTKSDTGVLMTAINEGMPVLDPSGAVDIKEGSKSLKEILAPLGQETDDFLAWIAANRSEKLLAEDRENLFTPEQIAAGKTLNKGREELYNDVKKDFEEMGAAITDIAVKTNLVNEEEAQQWKEEGFYVPFYRMLEEQETSRRGPGNINGLTNQKAYKKLKGGKSQLNDLLTNTLLNWNHLISAGLRNQAGKKALESAVEMDIASIVPKEIKSKDAVYIRDNGQEVWYELDQTPEGQLVLDSIMSLSYEGLNTPAMKTMRMFKRVLTQGVTASPGFKIRNLIRDSLHAPAVTTASKNPLKNIAVGFKYKADMKRMEAGGGAFSQEGYIHGNDPDAMKRLIGVASSSILNTPNKIALMWRKYENFGNTLENINRVASFKKDLAKGKSLLEANFNARDQLDFSRSGSFSAIRVLTQTIPFLNARMQGLDKIGRAVIDPAQRKQLAQVMGMYTIASVSLMLMMAGDDDYDEAPEWEKRTYHMFKIPGVDKMFRIPRPFEVGAIAYMSEEMAKQFADENSKAEDLGMALYHTLSDTFAMSIVPQAFKPMLEVYANKDSFRNTPIESMSMRNLSKKARYRPWTSKLAKGTSYAMSEVLPEGATLSPVQIQHLVRAYTGWAGATTLASIDFMLKKISGEITPETKISEYTWNPVSSFARDSGAKSTKYVTKFYDNMSELNKMWADIGKYRKTSGGKKVTAAQRNKLRYRKRYNRISKKLSSLRKQGELIYTSTSLTATQKRLRLKKLNIRKNALAKRTITISKEVF